MAWFLLRHALSTVKPYSDSMEKSQYGPPQDVLAPPYPGFPAGNQGSGGGTAYPPQPGFQGGPQPSMYPPPPQPSMYPTPLQYGTDMAQPTNAPGIHRGKREPNSGHTSNPGGGDTAAAAKRRTRPDDVSLLSGPGSDRGHTHPWTGRLACLWSPLLLHVLAMLLDSILR
ncbi:acidic proline-rich protein PRP25-like isoform X2 [Oncorhynchus masou masou]|uniref:acidic proline-rich protein PRP25-like isoform X2 n=1 Tax=Oncorhynchus masou masou TaxID=90313 RepID=UPI003182CEE5